MLKKIEMISIACIVGMIGDLILQMGANKFHMGGADNWGLKSYFSRHGSLESMFIAGGMMTFFYVIYYYLMRIEFTYINLIIYGIVLDYIFRRLRLFPSLDGYYEYFNYFWSGVWGAIPMIIPLIIFEVINKVF
jgi:hypothetical protein